jgi:hypothetical protein
MSSASCVCRFMTTEHVNDGETAEWWTGTISDAHSRCKCAA